MNKTTLPNIDFGRILRWVVAVGVSGLLVWRLWTALIIEQAYGPETWVRLLIAGLVVGGVYALIALGYTLVYGILFMINFAHGEIMMIGAYAGFFTLEALNRSGASDEYPVLVIITCFLIGMIVSMVGGIALERIAYRPLRGAPRLVPLISAIGASIFLQNAALLMFGATRRSYKNPAILERGQGWTIGEGVLGANGVLITYTGALTFVLSILLMIGLYILVQRTKMGKAMRAVAENKEVAALMGIDVDQVISRTFALSGLLAGAAGVMWGFHNGIFSFFVGFLPGLKAFTAAVLGGIGNIPGAMLGGLTLGLVESLGPAALGLDFQLKDVIGFSILVLILIFRPTGLLGEALSKQKA